MRNLAHYLPDLSRVEPRSNDKLVRVQGVSPFLFTLRLVAFNLASYPALADAA